MRMRALILFTCVSLSSAAQFDRAVRIAPIINFNVVLNGLGQNDAGMGLGLNASFFAKHKLQLLIESGTDRFIGDKVLRIDPVSGEHARNAIVYNLKAGPQLFISKTLSISITYDPSWYLVRDFGFTTGYGFKYGVSCYVSEGKKLRCGLSMIDVPGEYENIQYAALGIGYVF